MKVQTNVLKKMALLQFLLRSFAELDAQAALDEAATLYEMQVIAPEEIDTRTIPSHKLADNAIASEDVAE